MKKKITFEEGMQELEALVHGLEAGELSLEDSFKAYERAVALKNSLSALLDEVVPLLSTEEWAEVCLSKSIPFGPVLRLDDAMDDEYVQGGHLLDVAEHPSEGPIRMIGVPMQFSATPPSIRRHAPLPGADTEEVLAELAAAKDSELTKDSELAGAIA